MKFRLDSKAATEWVPPTLGVAILAVIFFSVAWPFALLGTNWSGPALIFTYVNCIFISGIVMTALFAAILDGPLQHWRVRPRFRYLTAGLVAFGWIWFFGLHHTQQESAEAVFGCKMPVGVKILSVGDFLVPAGGASRIIYLEFQADEPAFRELATRGKFKSDTDIYGSDSEMLDEPTKRELKKRHVQAFAKEKNPFFRHPVPKDMAQPQFYGRSLCQPDPGELPKPNESLGSASILWDAATGVGYAEYHSD